MNHIQYNEINLTIGQIYKIKNLETGIIKSCIFNSLCTYDKDGILITDNGDIFGFDDYGFENENPIKIKIYNSYKMEYKYDHKLFYENQCLQISDLFNKGTDFKGIWVII